MNSILATYKANAVKWNVWKIKCQYKPWEYNNKMQIYNKAQVNTVTVQNTSFVLNIIIAVFIDRDRHSWLEETVHEEVPTCRQID